MKKMFFLSCYAFIAFVTLALPFPIKVAAQTPAPPLNGTQVIIPQGFAQDFDTFLNAILSFVMVISALLVLLYLIWGGIQWITSGGDKGKTEAARNKIVAAVLGIIIVAASYAILTLVLRFLGFSSIEDVFDSTRTISGNSSISQTSTYQPESYTKLCGAGSENDHTLCNRGCDIQEGTCRSETPYVVKFVCDGKQTECGSNRSEFTTFQTVEGTACNKTVQIDIFDKNCVGSNNSWTCTDQNLQDFMVWYSGECR